MFSRFSALKSVNYRRLLGPLQQPTGIAAVVSIGIHGILFAASPQFSSFSLASLAESEPIADERTVPLVELTPAEQQRLPDFSGNSNTFSLLPQPGSLAPLQSPNSTASGATPYLSDSQPLPPNPFFYNPPIGNTPVRGNPSSSPGRTATRGRSSQQTRRSGQSRPETTVQSRSNQPRSGSVTEGVGEITAEELDQRTVGVDNLQIATRPSRSADDLRSPGSSATQSTAGSQAAAGEEANNEAEPAGSQTDAAASNPLREELEALQTAYTYSEAGTTSAAAETTSANWLAEFKSELEIAELPLQPAAEIPIDYPLRICLPVPPVTAQVGVVVSPAGEPVGEPTLLRSTGYAGLNQAALQAVGNADVAAGDSYQALRFTVPVQYSEAECTDPQALSQGVSAESD